MNKHRIPKMLASRQNHLRSNAGIALRNHGWGKKGKPDPFNIPVLCGWMGLDIDSAKDQRKIYHQVILQWRKQFTKWFKNMEFEGKIPEDANRYKIWKIVLDNYNQNDKYLFFAKRESTTNCYYVQPNLAEMEGMDVDRLGKQLKSIVTILQEMDKTGDRRLLPSGRNVRSMLEDTKKVKEVYIEDGYKHRNSRLIIGKERKKK